MNIKKKLKNSNKNLIYHKMSRNFKLDLLRISFYVPHYKQLFPRRDNHGRLGNNIGHMAYNNTSSSFPFSNFSVLLLLHIAHFFWS